MEYIPTRKNAKPWKGQRVGAKVRNAILAATRLLGRKICKKWNGYHRRSLVEIEMRCFKLLSRRVKARDFDRQGAELQVRAAILNRFTGSRKLVAIQTKPRANLPLARLR